MGRCCDIFWTSDDTKHAILASLVPGALTLYTSMSISNDQDIIDWWNSSRKPDWAPTSLKTFAWMDALTVAPVGYASCLIYKYGCGFENRETALALGLSGGSLLLQFLTYPFMKKKDNVAVYHLCVAGHLTAIGAAFVAHKIDHRAGLAMVPYVLWTGFYAVLSYCCKNLNPLNGSGSSY